MTKKFTNEDSQIDYGKTFEDFYLKYYDEFEEYAKDFFIKSYQDEVSFNAAYNDFEEFLRIDFRQDLFYPRTVILNELYHLFLKNQSRYKSNSMQKVFINIIKPIFDESDLVQFPKEYTFNFFIAEIALVECLNEISRLLTNNYFYFEMFYNSNRLNFFEIRDYPLAKEDYPYYKEMYAELYHEDRENKNLEVAENELIKPKKLPEKWYALLYWIELNANGQLPPRNTDGQFIKIKIEEIGRVKTGRDGQGFYNWVRNIADDLNDGKKINRTFVNWKEIITELSNNDPIIIDYIQKKYSS